METRAILLLMAAVAYGAIDQTQVISGPNRLIAAGTDGTVYLVGNGTIDPTPGAYISVPDAIGDYLIHVDPRNGVILYATYLNLYPRAIAVDSRGSVCVAGQTTNPNFPITAGAFERGLQGGEQMPVVKLNRSGTAEFATLLGGSASPYLQGSAGSVAFGPDGSIYVTGRTYSMDFPVTSGAFQAAKASGTGDSEAFFARLSADGSKLLYSTYLGGGKRNEGHAITLDIQGKAYIAGTTDSLDFPVTAGAFSTPIPEGQFVVSRKFVARWSPAAGRFDYIAAFGFADYSVQIAADSRGRAIVAGTSLLMLNDTGSGLAYSTSFGATSARVYSLGLDSEGNATVAGNSSEPPGIAPTIGANLLTRHGYGSAFIAKVNPAGHFLYSTYVDAPYLEGAGVSSGRIFLLNDTLKQSALNIHPPAPVAMEAPQNDRRSALYAVPNVVQHCVADISQIGLYWDTRNAAVEALEVHSNSPGGPLIASGLTGSAGVQPVDGATYYLQDVTGGKPLTAANTLAVERIAVQRAQRCAAIAKPAGLLTAAPNPVLACADIPYSGTQTHVYGSPLPFFSRLPAEIHVLSADGPLFLRGSDGVSDFTDDWVRNGMDFS